MSGADAPNDRVLSSYNKHFPDDVEDSEYIAEELRVMISTMYGQNILKSKYLSKYYRHIFEEPQ